jgi:hypothetical protein
MDAGGRWFLSISKTLLWFMGIKKGFSNLKPFTTIIFSDHYCTAAESTAVVSTTSEAESTTTSSVAVESTASAAGSVFLPQATKVQAKPQTANNANNFFIVTGFKNSPQI